MITEKNILTICILSKILKKYKIHKIIAILKTFRDVEEKQGERFDVYNVKMTFRKTSDINSEELSQIYTGDEFFMFLQYTGSQSK